MVKNQTGPDFKTLSTAGSLRYDTTGCAYILGTSTGEAVFIAMATSLAPGSTPTTALATLPAPTEFAGLASDHITPVFIHEAINADTAEYEALFSIVTLTTSVDWHAHTYPVDFAGLTYKAPQQYAAIVIDPAVTMFYLDSRVSTHLSNTESDFYTLKPITPRSISGIGVLSIFAVGIGTIKIVITKGMHLTLHDILFVPSATV